MKNIITKKPITSMPKKKSITTNNIKPSRKIDSLDVFFLGLAPLLCSALILLLPINLLFATLLFFGVPSAYVTIRRRDIFWRVFVYSLAVATISILTDYLAERDQSWVSTSMFDFRIAEVVPIEALVWMFMFTYLIVAVYLYFFRSKPHPVLAKRTPLVFGAAAAVLLWVILSRYFDLHFAVEYYYVKFGIAFLLAPLIAFKIAFPQYMRVFVWITPYFFIIGLLNLLVSLEAEHWSYPGNHFVGWVTIGPYRFPFEELFFWNILFAPFLVSQFDMLNNNEFKFSSSRLAQKQK